MSLSDTTKNQVTALTDSLKRPNAGGNGYGSAIAATEADRDLTENEALRMCSGMNDISREIIKQNTPDVPDTPSADKTQLNKTITAAENLKAKGALNGIDANIKKQFEESLQAAKKVFSNKDAT